MQVKKSRWVKLTYALLFFVLLGACTVPIWSGYLPESMKTLLGNKSSVEEHSDEHADHPSDLQSIELSPQAMNSLGLNSEYLRPIELTTFRRSISLPAVIISKPGRSLVQVSSPMNGIVAHVHAVSGEAVQQGELLFEVRLSFEDLVESQIQFLQTLGELEVEKKEIVRLEEATQSGAVSGKLLLDRRYAHDKLVALIRSQKEGLRLHGLSEKQVDDIALEGKLLREVQILAPSTDEHSEAEAIRLTSIPAQGISFSQNTTLKQAEATPDESVEKSGTPLILENLKIHKGQAVTAGELLCSLADYSELFIEGQAYEQDSQAISRANAMNWPVEVVVDEGDGGQILSGLRIAYVANSVNTLTRTLSFYVDLPNEVLKSEENSEKQRFITWRYRPGQRMQVRVPVEEWPEQIVLPIQAVARDGAEWFVFQQNGNKLVRVPVHVRFRDTQTAVIENDGSLFPGDVVAMRGAHQLLIAIKQQSGGGADPHAGHNH